MRGVSMWRASAAPCRLRRAARSWHSRWRPLRPRRRVEFVEGGRGIPAASGQDARACRATRVSSLREPRSSGRRRRRHRCRSSSRSSRVSPCRAGGRGAGHLGPWIAGVPPFLDADAVRPAVRADAGTIAQVTSTLRQEGLTVGTPSSTGLSLPVSGTVSQIESAFSTPIDRYHLASGKTGYDNRSAPQVPVDGGAADPRNPRTQHAQPAEAVDDDPTGRSGQSASPVDPFCADAGPGPTHAAARSCTTAIECQGGGALNAVQLAQAYSFGPLYSSNHYGAGITVALVELAGAGYLPS